MTERLRQDLALIDALEALPGRGQSEDLKSRLAMLCETQAIPARPEEIEQAITNYLAEKTPPTPSAHFALWPRPDREDSWLEAIDLCHAANHRWQRFTPRLVTSLMVFVYLVTLGFGWGLFPVCGMMAFVPAYFFSIWGCSTWKNPLAPWRRAKSMLKTWQPPKWVTEAPGEALRWLQSHQPDDQELARWRAHSGAAAALAQISTTSVPLLNLDAQQLNALVQGRSILKRSEPEPPRASAWKITVEADPMTDAVNFMAKTPSLELFSLPYPYKESQRASLNLSHHARHGQGACLTIKSGLFDSLRGVAVRFDEGPVQSFSASERAQTLTFTDHAKLFAQIQKARRVRIEVPFFKSPSQVFTFEVGPLEPWVSKERHQR